MSLSSEQADGLRGATLQWPEKATLVPTGRMAESEKVGVLQNEQEIVDGGMDSGDDEPLLEEAPDFYDAATDGKDERWVRKQRKGRTSDAILSCPACLTTLCLDCQRHDRYPNQYRAMFVRNCRIDESTVLRMAAPSRRPRKGSKVTEDTDMGSHRREHAVDGGGVGEVLRPVHCSGCGTQVAVMDSEEVYHFYDAIPSNS